MNHSAGSKIALKLKVKLKICLPGEIPQGKLAKNASNHYYYCDYE